jgi:hypothetical protein
VNVPNGHGSSPYNPPPQKKSLPHKGVLFFDALILLQFARHYKAKIIFFHLSLIISGEKAN